ncbi:MAG: pyridoxamine 5'-phosphate oxidase family protein [Deltaproteobacteria bacterium]|nr:pyridoxamine 5'-phosphate oxidase family protein [Deltaproteobacteria bacterium]
MKNVEKPDTRKAIRMTQAEASEWLEKGNNCSLATIGRDGYPHVVAMGYAVDKGDIVMTSFAKAQKVINLRHNAHAAVMVESGNAYHTLKGVMVRGRAEIIEDTEKVLEALSLVSRRTAQASGARAPNGGADVAVVNDQIVQQARRLAAKRVVIRIHPEKWASWDHSKLPPGKY